MSTQKRKNLMDNIKARIESGSYDPEQYYKKNEKNLKEKVKFFEKKIATGEMKDYMAPRYEQSKQLLSRLQSLKGGPREMAMPEPMGMPEPMAMPEPMGMPEPMAMPEQVNVPKQRKRKNKTKNNKPEAKKYTIKIRNYYKPLQEKQIPQNEYYLQAIQNAPPVPSLYNPFTGDAFRNDENPFDEIERAYILLKNLRMTVFRRANTLRKRGSKKSSSINTTKSASKRLSPIYEVNSNSNSNSNND